MKKYIVSNEEIMELLKNADDIRVRNKIVERMMIFVKAKVKRFKTYNFYDDLVQEGALAVMKAIENFDFERGNNFFIFANWHIKNRCKSFFNWHNKFHRPIPEDCALKQVDVIIDVEESYEKEEAKVCVNEIINDLPERDKKVLFLRYGFSGDKYTLKEVGKELNLSRQRIQQIEINILSKLSKNTQLMELGG